MYSSLLVLHSLFRWLVLGLLLFSIFRAYRGYRTGGGFARLDNSIRHWTATMAHLQLLLGVLLYVKSPLVKLFWGDVPQGFRQSGLTFFSLIHALVMLSAIVVLTLGSALAKRKATDAEKYRTMLLWFTISLLLIFLAIPWPFSPLEARPYLRFFNR